MPSGWKQVSALFQRTAAVIPVPVLYPKAHEVQAKLGASAKQTSADSRLHIASGSRRLPLGYGSGAARRLTRLSGGRVAGLKGKAQSPSVLEVLTYFHSKGMLGVTKSMAEPSAVALSAACTTLQTSAPSLTQEEASGAAGTAPSGKDGVLSPTADRSKVACALVTSPRPPRAPSGGGRAFLIGVAGGTASGKTSVCSKIMQQLESQNQGHVVSISQDCFYRNLTAEERSSIETFNFDHPNAFDFPELLGVMNRLRAGETVEVPIYDYVTSARMAETTPVTGASVVLLEGILLFHLKEIRDLFDMKIYVDTDADTRLARRVRRDIQERGRDVLQVLDRYERSVKPSFEQYTQPTKKYADIIVPRGADNEVAINLIVQHIKSLIHEEEAMYIRGMLGVLRASS